MIAPGLQPIIVQLYDPSPPGAAAAGARLIDTIDFSEMCAYASSWEGWAVLAYPQSSDRIVGDPAIAAKVGAFRDRLLSRWLGAESAVTKDVLYAEALTLTPDPGSALILCYHVCQLFSRGFVTAYWQRVEDWKFWGAVLAPGSTVRPSGDPVTDADYTTGTDFYRPVELNAALPGEVLQVRDRDSIFYLLFDKNEEWGVSDPGDWYHFFLMASIAYYAATGRVTDLNSPEHDAARLLSALGRNIIQGMLNVEGRPEVALTSMDRYDFAWRWANALSFLEGGIYGSADVTHECAVHRKGCLYGLRLAGETHHHSYLHWWVPSPGKLLSHFGIYLAQHHPIDVLGIKVSKDPPETEFWDVLAAIGLNDSGILGFLDLMRSQAPLAERSHCVLDGATGAVLPSHPTVGDL